MTIVRALIFSDTDQVLGINSTAIPAVAVLDQKELSRLINLSRMHIIAANGAVVLGYVLAFQNSDNYDGEEFLAFRSAIREPFVYIDQIAVYHEARGTGIGRRLYEALERSGAHIGARTLCCEVNTKPPNPSSLAFHKHLGFIAHGTLSTQDGRDVELLKKRIELAA